MVYASRLTASEIIQDADDFIAIVGTGCTSEPDAARLAGLGRYSLLPAALERGIRVPKLRRMRANDPQSVSAASNEVQTLRDVAVREIADGGQIHVLKRPSVPIKKALVTKCLRRKGDFCRMTAGHLNDLGIIFRECADDQQSVRIDMDTLDPERDQMLLSGLKPEG